MSANAVAKSAREDWIPIGRGAAQLGVSVPVVDKLIREGKLSVRRVGTWRRVRASEIAELDKESITPAVVR
jgi:excisionase family DNA binding protein